jgi:hypothetical protein
MKISVGQLKTLLRRLVEKKEGPDAGPFSVGDLVFTGKYKNSKGKIKKIFNDEKDHVAVEVEPDPKGRKKNKEISLYKIWPRDEKSDPAVKPSDEE